MEKTIRELTGDLLAAPSACKEIKDAAQNYLDAVGTEKEADAAKAYVAEMEADIPGPLRYVALHRITAPQFIRLKSPLSSQAVPRMQHMPDNHSIFRLRLCALLREAKHFSHHLHQKP